MSVPADVVPYRFDLSALVRRSVATLYSHLVTRPTGQALRLGIETQIGELGAPCVSVLDFSQVVVLDYSCADETVAKLIQRYQREDRPAEAYFVARGVGDRHHQAIEAVLARHGLALVAELDEGGYTLLVETTPIERAVWGAAEAGGSTTAARAALALGLAEADAAAALERLGAQRVLVRRPANPPLYLSLSAAVLAA
jgi:hypothetical protein